MSWGGLWQPRAKRRPLGGANIGGGPAMGSNKTVARRMRAMAARVAAARQRPALQAATPLQWPGRAAGSLLLLLLLFSSSRAAAPTAGCCRCP